MKMTMNKWLHFAIVSAIFACSIAMNCPGREVALVWDVSSTVTDELDKIKTFSKVFAQDLPIGDDARIAVATFSNYARKEIFCDQHSTVSSFSAAVDRVNGFGMLTNIRDGLLKGQELLNERGCTVDSSKTSVLVLLTDGVGNVGTRAGMLERARIIRASGIIIFSIGIGMSSQQMQTLREISGEFVQGFDNFDKLMETKLFDLLSRVPCAPEETETLPPTTTTTPPTTTTTPPTTTTTPPTTTTTPPTTTTTPPITTTTPPTTTTTTTTTTPPPPQRTDCSCSIADSAVPCLGQSIKDMLAIVDGRCILDRLRIVRVLVTASMNSLAANMTRIFQCKLDKKQELRNIIIESNNLDNDAIDIYFNEVGECIINVECKMKRWMKQLQLQNDILNNEIDLLEHGFVDTSSARHQLGIGNRKHEL